MTHVTTSLALVTAPAILPVSLQQAKDNMRVTHTSEDAEISVKIEAAVREAEAYTGRAFITQTWTWTADAFPPVIWLPKPPLQSVTHVKYLDTTGTLQTLAASDYRVDAAHKPAMIAPAWGKTWPAIRAVSNAVEVQFVAGYGDNPEDIPPNVVEAVLLIIGDLYQHREDTTFGQRFTLPRGARDKLGWDRTRRFVSGAL